MEKHPIDSHFKEGLGGFRPQPSADAWARLQSRMNSAGAEEAEEAVAEKEERKPLFMWYSIAAAIALLLVSVGVYRVNFGTNLNQTIAKTTKTEQVEKAKNNLYETNSAPEKENLTPELIAGNEPIVQPEMKEPGYMESGKAEAKNENNQGLKRAETKTIATAQINTVKNAEKEKPSIKHAASENPDLVSENKEMLAVTNSAKPENKKEETTAKPETGEGLEIIVIRSEPKDAVAATTQEKEQMGKLKLAKNIFRQARNLKNGEKIDLQEIGIDPNSKLAMETKNIKHNITNTFTKVLEL